MNHKELLEKMVPPGARRPGAYLNGIIQIHVTRACDKSCYNCTQGSNFGGLPYFMSPELFEKAVLSLKNWWGVVGVFGGNPAVSPYFADYCNILKRHISFEQRGLWCNHPRGKGKLMAETFNPRVSNLNVHMDAAAYMEFKRDWPDSNPFGLNEDSLHSPVWVSMKDMKYLPTRDGKTMDNTEENRNLLIADCDINKYWSAMIGLYRGNELRAWFCEVAGAQAMLQQSVDENYPDTGIEVFEDWWKLPMTSFSNQVLQHCHNCGVPMRGIGTPAQAEDGFEHKSEHYPFATKRKRKIKLVVIPEDMNGVMTNKMTDYIGNLKRVQ